MPTTIDPDKFDEIQNSDETWIIDIWAEWCGPCQKYKPIFEETSEEMENVNFGKVPVHDHKELAQKMGARALPTTVIMKSGDTVAQKEGVMGKEELKNWIEEKA